jgi:DnaK suppressor protein
MDELTEPQRVELMEVLKASRDHLVELLSATREGTRPVDLDEPIGRLTRMDAMQQQSMSAASRSGYDLRLRQVRQALTLDERGEYGLCVRCEEPIGFARLKVRPESPYCLECQEEIDAKYA